MKKERRSLYQMVFGNKQEPTQVQVRMLNGYNAVFSDFGNEAYTSDVVRSAVDAIARNGAKLKAKHVRKMGGQLSTVASSIEYMLQTEPNPYMDAYTFLYKTITNYCMKDNSFVQIQKNGGRIKGYYPLNYSMAEAMESDGEIWIRFRFESGETKTIRYADLIHLRRHFYKNDIFGESSDIALLPTLELIKTTIQGIINAIKSSAALRGVMKFVSMLKPEDMKKQRDTFVNDYMGVDNNGGIAAVDGKFEFQPLENKPVMVNKSQMDHIKQSVYDFFGVNENIVQNKYSEDEWNAFYESCIEPIAIQLGLQCTIKSFTPKEKGFGNEIVFESNRLQYASNTTKKDLIKELMPMGLLTTNQALEILNMPPIEGGDKRIMSLNYIDASAATEYQLAKAKGGKASEEPAQKD